VLLLLIGRTGWSTLREAWNTYVAHWHVFAALGLVLIPIGLVANAAQFLFVDYPPGKTVLQTMDSSPASRLAIALTIGGLQDVLSLVLIGPAVIAAVGEIRAGRTPTFIGSYRTVFARIRPLIGAVARSVVVILLLTLSIVGIPWAIAYTVRWLFVTQAVLLDGAGPRSALQVSRQTVGGHWWRTAGTALFLTLVGVAPAPLIGLVLLIGAQQEVRHVNWVSSLIYALLLPIAVIGMTLLYQRLKGDTPRAPATATDSDEAFGGSPAVTAAPTS
jgi:hypothetical protein